MINVSSRRCQQAGCLRHPNFGFPGDRRASYCRLVNREGKRTKGCLACSRSDSGGCEAREDTCL